MENQKVKVNINGADYEVAAGLNILEACKSLGIEIPFFCYHPSLKVAGSCRMCLVQIVMVKISSRLSQARIFFRDRGH